MRFHQGYCFHCAGVSCAFLTLNCSACIFIDIISLDSDEAENQEKLVKLSSHRLNLGHTLKAAEFFYESIINMLDGQCDMIIEAICIPVIMGNGGCITLPAKTVCGGVITALKILAYIVLLSITIAYQAVDQAYDIASLGEYLCCLMSHISITNQTSCQFKYFFVSYVRCKHGHLWPIL